MGNKPNSLLGKFLVWRLRHIHQRQFILILSVVVGLISGLVAVTLKNTTHLIQQLVHSDWFDDLYNPFYFVFPVVGILITVLIKRAFKSNIGEGIPSTLYAISRRSGILRPFKMYASVITSMFTVGFGGSVGLEGPTVSTGSAIGSNLARWMHLNYKSRTLLISCATAAAISSIFNAPIAGIIFTIEIFSLDLTLASLIPLLLASATGAMTSLFLQGSGYLFHYNVMEKFEPGQLPFYVLLGVGCALVSVYFNKVFLGLEELMAKFKGWVKLISGGFVLGLLIFLIPPLYGEGYETINSLLSGDFMGVLKESFILEYSSSETVILGLLLGLGLFKVFAASLTLSSGGVGGIFAPSLYVGASFGFFFSKILNSLGLTNLPESQFALAGMAGLMAGVLHAPLTAIFMIAEITGGYSMFLPLMLTSAASFLVTRSMMPHSIYTVQLAKRGDLLTHDKDHAILTLMKLDQVIECDFIKVNSEMKLGDLVAVFKKSKRNLFPVLNEENELVGVLTLDHFKQLLFDQTMHDKVMVRELMIAPPAIIDKSENMDSVLEKFQNSQAWNLPVVDNGFYVGFVSKSKLFSAYRRKLKEVSD